MNSKNIKRHLNIKLNDWLGSIEDTSLRSIIKNNAIITGGALVSLLTDEVVNDYDIYFKTKDAAHAVATYYANNWNNSHIGGKHCSVIQTDDCVECFISSTGVVEDAERVKGIDNPYTDVNKEVEDTEKPKYRPVFITSNAITLSDKIQVVLRFYGDVEEIHKNYDFAHCTCAWSSWDNELVLPQQALECIINKELYYIGSKYPLCSIIRTRKFLKRGYTINAGQYVKMAMQLNDLNLKSISVLKDQLTGVDTTYFQVLVENLTDKYKDGQVENSYVFELIDRMF